MITLRQISAEQLHLILAEALIGYAHAFLICCLISVLTYGQASRSAGLRGEMLVKFRIGP